MKRLIMIAVLAFLAASVAPGHAFIDYLFGGSQTRNVIDNSAVGDLRAWWTGNPAYQFNPYYSGSANPGQSSGMSNAQNMQGSAPPMGMQQQGNYQPQPQPSVSYFPQQGQQQYDNAPVQGQYQGQPIYGAAGASLPIQGPPQAYQQPTQQYQQPTQQYQQVPQQQYQQPAQYQQPPQAYQQPAQQYQYPAGYPNQ